MADKYSSFDIPIKYQNRIDIMARGMERALQSLGLDIEIKSKRFMGGDGERISFEFTNHAKEN